MSVEAINERLGAERDRLTFLRAWLARVQPGELLEVRTLNKLHGPPLKKQDWFSSASKAEKSIERSVGHGDDVYIGVLPRSCRAGTADAVASLRWIWADIDYGTVGHAKPAPYAARGEALAAVRAVENVIGAATFIVDTGGGLHAWWALSEALAFEAHRDALTRVVFALGADMSATDLPRILRVPGTYNFKVPESPRPVVLFEHGGAPVDVAKILSLPAAPADAEPAGGQGQGPRPATPRREPGPRREGPFTEANDVPVHEVLAALGIEMHNEGHRTFCACPVHRGSNTSQMLVGGQSNVASCFGDCAGKWYSPVDLVAAARSLEPRDAVNWIAQRFGFEGFTGPKRGAPPVPPTTSKLPPDDNTPPPTRPAIQITTDERAIADQTIEALAVSAPTIYQRGASLVRTGIDVTTLAPTIQPLPMASLREAIADAVDFIGQDRKGNPKQVHQPKWLTDAVFARGTWTWAGMRGLRGIVEVPVLRADGTVFDTPGYDPATQLVYLPSDSNVPRFDRALTREDALAAMNRIDDLVSEFPWETDADKSTWLAALLTPFAKFAIDDCVPCFIFEANTPGTGKSTLADIISILYAGRKMPRWSYTADDNELHKQVTAIAASGLWGCLFDNVTSAFGGDALEAALTGTVWQSRPFGHNDRIVTYPLNVMFVATGNGMTVKGDMPRRCLRSRIVTDLEKPAQRGGFKHSLPGDVFRRRAELVHDVLTVLAAFYAAGRPKPAPKLREFNSYESWSGIVRNCIVWLGRPDPVETNDKIADPVLAGLGALLTAWREVYDDQHATIAEAVRKVTPPMQTRDEPNPVSPYPHLEAALVELNGGRSLAQANTKSMGQRMNHQRERIAGGMMLVSSVSHKTMAWGVRLSGGSNGSRGSNSDPSVGERFSIPSNTRTARMDSVGNTPPKPLTPPARDHVDDLFDSMAPSKETGLL